MSNDAMGAGVALGFLVFYLVIVVVMIVAYWKIWSKAGFNGAWSLLMLIPLANIIAFLYLAFAEWPIHKRMGNPATFD